MTPSAKQPCACVDLAPGEVTEEEESTKEDGTTEDEGASQGEQPGTSQATPSRGGSSGSGGGSGSGASIGESPEIKGFQGLPWGATPDMVIEELGQPTYGKWKNFAAAKKEWDDNRWGSLPSEVDAVLGWRPYTEGDINTEGRLWAGFSETSGQKRLVYIYIGWSERPDGKLDEGNFNFVKNHFKSKFNNHYGDPLETDVCVGPNTPLSIPWDEDTPYDLCNSGYSHAGFQTTWKGTYGVARIVKDAQKDFVGTTLQSQKLHNARAPFPPEGKLSNLNLAAGQKESSVDTYGQIIESVQKGRIDGFRGSPWGSSPQEVLNNSKLGKPKTRSGRKLAEKVGLNLPNEGKTVWVYEEEILGVPAQVWVAFENYHKPGQPGLIWTGTTWADMNDDDYNRIADELKSILSNSYGDPSLEDEKRTDIESSMGFFKYSESSVWKDGYGRIYLHPNPRRENVIVQYQSQALVDKRESEVQEAESKF